MNGPKLLVVEDIRDTLAGTLAELAGAGIEIEHVTNVKDAVACLRRTKYDIVLLDWRLPLVAGGPVNDDAGLAVLKHTRSPDAGENQGFPEIVLTAEWSIVDAATLTEHRNCRYVISKLRMDDITGRTQEMLGGRTSPGPRARGW